MSKKSDKILSRLKKRERKTKITQSRRITTILVYNKDYKIRT